MLPMILEMPLAALLPIRDACPLYYPQKSAEPAHGARCAAAETLALSASQQLHRRCSIRFIVAIRWSRWSGRLCMHAPVREGAVWCELVEPGELSVPCLWSQSSCLPQRTSSLRASGLSPSGGPRAAPSAEPTHHRPLGPPPGPSTLSARYELRPRDRPRLSPSRWLATRPEQAQDGEPRPRARRDG